MEPMTPVRHRRADRYRELPAEAPQKAPAENVQEPIQEPIAAAPTLRAQTPPRPAALRAPRPQLPLEAEAAAPLERPPRAAASRKRPQEKVKADAHRMPTWLTITICVCILLCGALFAGECLMRAYLTQRQNEREAAYQRVVDAHPLPSDIRTLIEQYAAENNLQPAFVASIVLNESSYRTDAESGVGARGLMQLMPETAQWIAGKLKLENYSFAMMYDAETNIRFGTWYLNYLAGLFQGDPTLVACAYHAGQGEVRGWLSDPGLSEDGVTLKLENLADGPTKTYAGRVTRDYGIYEALYYTPAEAPADVAADAGAGLLRGSVR